ncbi:hypothetical protein FHT08_004016 [Xanthomonas campestris]|uniref:Uncharacterized protein n=1 Tax=Xanthomonas arboricola TaxID=56448 RepID=A0A2S7AED1_9XANT|nr:MULTISPECIES: hypothetical protein [Xanthomonas]NIJ78874.1 hypothetical protein [Xanthomonas sp. CFBP 8151]PPU08115.1 hypothetical protein XarjCFBP7645_11180 [Xanthomonas arboricola]
MKLQIDFAMNLANDELLKQKKIPCVCKISRDFEISFPDSAPESSGTVSDWDRGEFELRAVPGTGGQYTHNARSLITIERIEGNIYKIIDLDIFNRLFGWCTVLEGGLYAPPGKFWDEE